MEASQTPPSTPPLRRPPLAHRPNQGIQEINRSIVYHLDSSPGSSVSSSPVLTPPRPTYFRHQTQSSDEISPAQTPTALSPSPSYTSLPRYDSRTSLISYDEIFRDRKKSVFGPLSPRFDLPIDIKIPRTASNDDVKTALGDIEFVTAGGGVLRISKRDDGDRCASACILYSIDTSPQDRWC